MRYFIRLVLVLCCALAGLQTAPALAEKRVALVIGNAGYSHHARLPNVPNDAAAMAALFKAAKFDAVEVKLDLGVAALRRALREFSSQAAGADVAVLFFAGHGIEVDRTNYLIPVDARLATDLDVKDETVSLDRVLEFLEPARRLRLVILDACRDNPFAAAMKRTSPTRSVSRGLGRTEPHISNTLIAYATRSNDISLDGKGANSPFTAALAKYLPTPGLDLRIALGHVRDEVLAATGNKQEPYFTGSLGGGIVSIAAPLPKPDVVPAPMPLSAADRMWAVVKDSTSIPALEAFRRQYGQDSPVYDRLAEARIGELKKQQLALLKAKERKNRAEAELRRPGREFRDCPDVCPEMVVLPAGEFMMGSPPDEAGQDGTEGPQRKVTIAQPFAVGKFEVTFAEWDACVAADGCLFRPEDEGWGRGRRPVINVSWYDAKEYAAWLSRKAGKTYRLLSEAEWEFAVRAGTTTRYAFGDTITTRQAQYSETHLGAPGKTVEVGLFPPNKFGLHDLHGNVAEWVEDAWHPNYHGAPTDGSVRAGGNTSQRVLRGGSWGNYGASYLRSARRDWFLAMHHSKLIGFRVSRTL
jgi:formylglycine-generating enzyme required for sulfatase activity